MQIFEKGVGGCYAITPPPPPRRETPPPSQISFYNLLGGGGFGGGVSPWEGVLRHDIGVNPPRFLGPYLSKITLLEQSPFPAIFAKNHLRKPKKHSKSALVGGHFLLFLMKKFLEKKITHLVGFWPFYIYKSEIFLP